MTIKEIAKICNVSTATVSNVINGKNKSSNETTKKIMDVIRESGYQPSYLAKNLRSKRTKTIGIIVEDLMLFNIPAIIEGIMECCEKNGYKIILENLRLYVRWHGEWFHNDELRENELRDALKQVESVNVDGIIYVAGHERRMEVFQKYTNLPTVVAYTQAISKNIPSVMLDDYNGGYAMTAYLLSKGHERIGVIAGEQDNAHAIHRMKGIQKAFFEHGKLFDPDLVEYVRWEREGGYSVAKKMADQKVSAIFCMSDTIAGGVYDYMNENGIVIGKDISVVGYDNRMISEYLVPKLTTMRLPLEQIGYKSADILIGILEKNELPENMEVRMECQLIERDSVVDLIKC